MVQQYGSTNSEHPGQLCWKLPVGVRNQQATEVVQAVALDPTDGTVLLTAAPVQPTAPPRPYGDL